MSLSRDYGKIVFECNNCGETLETEERNFDRAREALERAGWLTNNVSGQWVHFDKEKCRTEYLD